MRIIKAGATSQSIYLEVLDSTSTSGARKTGLAFNTSSLTAYYALNGAAAVQITLVTLASASAAWSSGGFVEVSSANMPGVYRLDVPNAALTGAVSVVITLKGATGMVQESVEILLVAFDPQSASAMITGVNSLAPPTNWNLESIDGSGRVDVGKVGGTAQTARDLGASVLLSPGTGTGQLDITSGVVKANLVQILATALTETAGLLAGGFKKFFNVASPTGTLNDLPGVVPGASGGLPTTDANNAVKLQSGTGANQISLASGLVTVGTNNDKTGYTASTVSDKTGYSLAAKDSVAVRNGTAQAGGAGTITLDSGASATDSFYNGLLIKIDSGTGAGQARTVTGYVGSTKVATVDRNWVTSPDGSTVFTLVAADEAALNSSLQPVAASVAGSVGSVGSGGITNTSFAAGAIDANAIATDAIGSAELATSAASEIAAAVRDVDNTSPAAGSLGAKVNSAASAGDPWATALPGSYGAGTAGKIVGTNLDAASSAIKAKTDNLPASPAAVGSAMTLANGAITAAVVATDAIDADALASDAVTEIQTGLSTLNAAGVRTAVGLASANLDTQLSGINAKTTNLPATPASTGDAMALTTGERISVATAVWAAGSRTLTSFGTLVADAAAAVWAAGARTLTALGVNVTVGGYAGGQDPATLVLDVAASGHNTSGTIGAKINSAASGSDPTAIANQVNTTLSGAHGSGAWGSAGAGGAFTVPIRVRDANTAANLVGVLVSIYDGSGTTLLDQKRTGSTGIATFSLDAATYTVRVSPQAGYGSLADQALVISGNASTTDYTLAPLSIPNVDPANTVTYFGYEYLLDGETPNGAARVQIELLSAQPVVSGQTLLDNGPLVFRPNDAGYWSASLVRGKQYQVSIDASGVSRTFTVSSDLAVTAVNIKDVT